MLGLGSGMGGKLGTALWIVMGIVLCCVSRLRQFDKAAGDG